MSAMRQALVDKLAHSQMIIEKLRQQGEVARTALEWEKGYAKALEEVLGLDGVSLRRYPRRTTVIPTEIDRVQKEGPTQKGRGMITDLTMEGCGLATVLELSVGEIIALAFTLPGRNTPVTLEGWVRRAQRVEEVLSAGVEFKESPGDVVKEFQTFLTSALEED